jgi:DegV family protein with EDD domain
MKIITDSAADLTLADLSQGAVIVAPLLIQYPEGEVTAESIGADAFYRRLAAMQPQVPTTAQPSLGALTELYRGAGVQGDEVLAIHISSGLSGTANTARQAAAAAGPNVHVVDSLTLSGGQRFQVLAAGRAAAAGWLLASILERLRAIREATEVIFTLETLEYLQRGGRIGRVQALAGALLNLKPLIHVNPADGKYDTVGRARGFKRALGDLADYVGRRYGGRTPVCVSVMHGQAEEGAAALAALLRERLSISQLETLRISPVLGVHTGPGVVGAAVVPAELLAI